MLYFAAKLFTCLIIKMLKNHAALTLWQTEVDLDRDGSFCDVTNWADGDDVIALYHCRCSGLSPGHWDTLYISNWYLNAHCNVNNACFSAAVNFDGTGGSVQVFALQIWAVMPGFDHSIAVVFCRSAVPNYFCSVNKLHKRCMNYVAYVKNSVAAATFCCAVTAVP